MPYLVRNERLRYAATWLNTLSIGCVVIGVFTPIGALSQGLKPGE